MDKTFDGNWIIEDLNQRGAEIVISQRLQPLPIDDEMYKRRHLIENHFPKLKEFKRIAMRSDKTDTSFAAMICLCSAIIDSKRMSTDPRTRVVGKIDARAASRWETSERFVRLFFTPTPFSNRIAPKLGVGGWRQTAFHFFSIGLLGSIDT